MTNLKHTIVEDSVLKTLKYFDYFSFPLTLNELHKYLDTVCSREELKQTLDKMVAHKSIFMTNNIYLISNTIEKIDRKLKGKIEAEKRIKRAKLIAKLINFFPFVRSVSISGSLSKMYADKNSDIDFFITTNNSNLWTCRTMLHILKKISFLFNLQHSFCMNYFISNKNLIIEEQNYFTAVELSTLIPLYGKQDYIQLMKANNWIHDILPNYVQQDTQAKPISRNLVKRLLEFIFSSQKLNLFLLNYTNKTWKKKWKKKGYDMKDYDLAFKTKRYVSKNHPKNYQKLVLKYKDDK